MTSSLTRNLIVITAIALVGAYSGLFSAKPAFAGQLMPSVQDQIISYGQNLSGELKYINTSDVVEKLSVEIFSYNPRESEIITNGEILMSTEVSDLTVDPGQEVMIPYQVNAITELAKGSYFNVVALIDASEESGYSGTDAGSGNVKFNLRKGEGALFAFHVTDGGEVLSAQDISLQSTAKRNWFLLPFFQLDPQITVTNNSPYPIKVTGELRLFTKDGELLATTRVEDVRLYPGDSIVETATTDYIGLEDVKMVYSFGNNLGSNINTDTVAYKNFTIYLLLGAVALIVVSIAVVKVLLYQKKLLNSAKGIA